MNLVWINQRLRRGLRLRRRRGPYRKRKPLKMDRTGLGKKKPDPALSGLIRGKQTELADAMHPSLWYLQEVLLGNRRSPLFMEASLTTNNPSELRLSTKIWQRNIWQENAEKAGTN